MLSNLFLIWDSCHHILNLNIVPSLFDQKIGSIGRVARSTNFTGAGIDNDVFQTELLNGIRYEVEAKQLPPRASAGMLELYSNYRDAVSPVVIAVFPVRIGVSQILSAVLLQQGPGMRRELASECSLPFQQHSVRFKSTPRAI